MILKMLTKRKFAQPGSACCETGYSSDDMMVPASPVYSRMAGDGTNKIQADGNSQPDAI